MPINYARRLTGRQREPGGNRQLGMVLAFVAGAANAGGFVAVHQYTSHMTGIVSAMADHAAAGAFELAAAGLAALLAFIGGAACCALMVNYARRRALHSVYALPLLFEAVLLLSFGMLGTWLASVEVLIVPATVTLLCFMMGLQNAVITKLSNAEIRTTHITGVVTDIGIELGKALYPNRDGAAPPVVANRGRLCLLAMLALCFFVGGIVGATGFARLGYAATVPLATMLVLLAIVPVVDDLRRLRMN
ncbi:YoaK family protein [Massilia sp. METH4]|uniref:YoaK family protein n=1 Tax=Massilia sp. METH4 TaxID=3123041 RepID=UPI0030D3FEC7